MILIDTAVWIDFFADRKTQQVKRLVSEIEQSEEICICGIILTEILQGIKKSNEYHQVKTLMDSLIFLEMNKDTFIFAAEIYRTLRSKGITIRKILDCMIAAIAIENKISLLHNDRDFDPIEKYYGLKVISTSVN